MRDSQRCRNLFNVIARNPVVDEEAIVTLDHRSAPAYVLPIRMVRDIDFSNKKKSASKAQHMHA